LTFSISLLAMAIGHLSLGTARVGRPRDAAADSQGSALATTVAYVVPFYFLWFTYNQSQFASRNCQVGPVRLSPIYQIMVAINDD
jgi:hypothetical protein